MKYWTRDREAGNKIESFASSEEAEAAILKYEEEDIRDGSYSPDFYEVYSETPQDRYQAAHVRRYAVKCIDTTEQDIIDWLDSKPNKAGYIKRLIRADMERQ